jgi:quinohemoprotein ethanol dehydrogenase
VVDVPGYVDNEGSGEDIVMLTEVDGRPHAPGKLVAFDPVSASIRWTVDHPLPFNGGLMATAGNLVFQGNAEGRFEAYAAATGELLWSVQTGSAINAAPASYAIDGTQYVLIPVGSGGGVQFLYPEMHADAESKGPTRLMAFTLEGQAKMPPPGSGYPPLPEQPALEASAAEIEDGKRLYAENCKSCHGAGGVARFGGSVPDLRWSNAETHAMWDGIVIGGARAANGMPAFDLTIEESQAIRLYLLSLADEIRASR